MDSSKLKVPIVARFTRMFAFLKNASLMGLLAAFLVTSPVALAESILPTGETQNGTSGSAESIPSKFVPHSTSNTIPAEGRIRLGVWWPRYAGALPPYDVLASVGIDAIDVVDLDATTLSNLDVVYIGRGAFYVHPGQGHMDIDAVETWVTNGGGIIGESEAVIRDSECTLNNDWSPRLSNVFGVWSEEADCSDNAWGEMTVEITNTEHPISQNLPSSWTVGVYSGENDAYIDLQRNSSSVEIGVITDKGSPPVIASTYGSGKAVYFPYCPDGGTNWSSVGGQSLKDLFVNAVNWAAGGGDVNPPVIRPDPTPMPQVTLAPNETAYRTLTLHNDGDGVLNATISTVGVNAQHNGGNPELIPGTPQSDSSITANSNADSKNIGKKEVGDLNPVFTPLASNLNVLYLNSMLGGDPSFISGLQGLPNIGTLDILDGNTSTPNLDYLNQYDVVILASNFYFADSSTLGNNLADYVDAGGRVILLGATFHAGGGWALDGRIVTSAYSPLAVESYDCCSNWSNAVSFANHPITQSVTSLSTNLYAYSVTTQGNGQSLGLYDSNYLIGAYNPDKPIVAINVFPFDTQWNGDLIRLVGNALDWVADSGPNGWLSVAPTTVQVQPHSSAPVELTYDTAGMTNGNYAADINIASNDPVNPTVTVPATLLVQDGLAPILRPDPNPMPLVTLRQDESPTPRTLTLHNDGDGELTFDLSTQSTTTSAENSKTNPIPYMEIGKAENDPRQGPPVTQGSGDPDTYGYSWIDSDETGGPNFDWIDISSTGTLVSGLTDDNHVGPFSIGFDFDFYGTTQTQFYVQSNGLINFDNQEISLSNQSIPTADNYNNLIAWMWDDMHPQNGNVYYQVIDNKLVVQFDNYGEYGGSGRVDAQVILYSNGNIKIQYSDFRNGIDLDGSTIGIENATGMDGLQVAFNVPYLHNELAILFSRGASWLTLDPLSGSIAPNGSQDITVTYDASAEEVGDYEADIIIASNDPANPEVTVPATLQVTDRLPGEMTPSPGSIEYTLSEGETADPTLTLSNTGLGNLSYNVSVGQIAGPTMASAQREPSVLTDIPDGVEYVEGELLVKLADGINSVAVAPLRVSVNATIKKTIPQLNLEVWSLPVQNEAGLLDVIRVISTDQNIIYAEPNYIQKAIGIPNDSRFNDLWGMHNTGQTSGTPNADIDAVEAWDTFTGSHDVVVAVIDTGVDYNHVDLVDNRWVNVAERDGDSGVDDDGNGFIDDVYGYDFAYGDSDPMDSHSHGTHCSGTIGGVGNNSTGVAGVSHVVRIMAVRFIRDDGYGTTDAAISSIIYAVDNGAQILSNSWGGGPFEQALEDAIIYAHDHNVLFVAAAGNGGYDGIGDDNDMTPHYPSNYDVPNVMSVAATDHNDARASFSNYGLESVDLGAPGVNIWSTVPGNSYSSFNGTSMATPHVSGAAALLLGYNPDLTALELKSIIMDSVDPVASMSGITVTGGRLNINNALMMADAPWITLEGELSGDIPPSGSVDVTVHLDATELADGDYTAEINVSSSDLLNPDQVVDVLLHVGDGPNPGTVVLAIDPPLSEVSIGQEFDVRVMVQAGEQLVDGVSAYLNFDTSYLQVNELVDGGAFSFVLDSSFDNDVGNINFAAGSVDELPSGTFTLVTINMTAIAETPEGGTDLPFIFENPRHTNVTFGGDSVFDHADDGVVEISNRAMVTGSLDLQGRPDAPDPSWILTDMRVSFTVHGEQNPLYEFVTDTNDSGVFEVGVVDPGIYDMRVKGTHTLQNLVPVTLVPGDNPVNVPTLLEGDANDDNVVTILDFSILASSFGKSDGDPGFDARADFNQDGFVTILDFSLLAVNFGQGGAPNPSTAVVPLTPGAGPVVLAVSPAETNLSIGETSNIAIEVQGAGEAINGIQIYLNFDPAIVEVGTLGVNLTGWQVFQNSVNNETGQIDFSAITFAPAAMDTFNAITIPVTALAVGSSPFAFESVAPRETDVATLAGSVFDHADDGTVVVPPTFNLTVTKSGDGTGHVSSDPAGIDCGADCTETYNENTEVTLTATPDADMTFEGWTGCPAEEGGESSHTDCTITMDMARTVNAEFGVPPAEFNLTVTKSGDGTGLVGSSPAGIDCGTDCSEVYDEGMVVTLTATPDTDMTFESWTGCSAEVDNVCTVTMDADLSVDAAFGMPVSSGPNDVVIDFGPGFRKGIWALMNNDSWADLHHLSPMSMVIGDIDGSDQDDVIVDFGPGFRKGIWALMNNSTWVSLHSLSPESMTTGDIDGDGFADVIIDFGPDIGVWLWMNNNSWVSLHSLSPESMTTGDIDGSDQDDVIMDFGSLFGIWAWMNNSTWVSLHHLSPPVVSAESTTVTNENMTTGDIDGGGLAEVIIDFGDGYGIWVWMNNSTWVQLHTLSPDSMVTGYLDNNAQADVIIDFGPGFRKGIWARMNNSTWVQLHTLSSESMVTGNIDGQPSVDQIDTTTQEGPAKLDNAEPLPKAELMSLPTKANIMSLPK